VLHFVNITKNNKHQKKVKHQEDNKKTYKVGQVQINFTDKPLTAWGGLCSAVAKYIKEIGFPDFAFSLS